MKGTIIIAVAAALLLVGLIVRRTSESNPASEDAKAISTNHFAKTHPPASRIQAATAPLEAPPEEPRATNLIARLFKNGEAPKLTAEQIESYLATNRRNPESLLAAFRVTKDKAFLKEAQEKFPMTPV